MSCNICWQKPLSESALLDHPQSPRRERKRTAEQTKKSPRSLLPSSTIVNQCIYLRNVLRGTGVLVFGRCLELMGGCLWCPSVCQTLREWGNEGGWDTCLYPGCLFNTSRVMKDSWKHSRLFDFSLWCSALPYDDGILPQWWSVFAVVAQAGLEGKWDLEVSILVKMKIICSVRHNFVFIFLYCMWIPFKVERG